MSVTIGGTFSGLNVSSIISAVIAADSIPITNLQSKDTTLSSTSSDLGSLGSSLGNLSASLQTLGSNTLFSSQAATSSVTSVGSATVGAGATAGTFSLDVTQLASSSVLRSGTTASPKLTPAPGTGTLIKSVLNESTVAGQTFTVNGKTITLADTDTLGDVLNKINDSGSGATASYNATTGAVTITAATPVLLGSGADTSDFLQQAQLFNNGADTVSSTTGLGRIDPTADLATVGLATTPAPGTYTINGVSFTYNAGDSLNSVIGEINASSAGVTAVYDTYSDQIALTSSTRGAQSITVADGTSNLASALRLTTTDSTLTAGQTTQFSVNGGATRQSTRSTIDSGTLGIPGVSFTATSTGTTNVTVAPDVTTIAAALNAFVTQYNSTQNVIESYTKIDTADTTQNGSLAADNNLTFLSPQLRTATSGSTSSTATIRMLSDLGINTNANDNTITQVDTTKLQNALTNHLSDVEALFNDPTHGLTNSVQSVISTYNDSLNGVIVNEQDNINSQITFNKSQITRMQEQIANETTVLQNEFAQLDAVEAKLAGVSSILSGSSGTSTSTTSASSGSSSFGSVGGTSSTS